VDVETGLILADSHVVQWSEPADFWRSKSSVLRIVTRFSVVSDAEWHASAIPHCR
jgi:hypothetical protein